MNNLEWLSVGSAILVLVGFLAANLKTMLTIAREFKRSQQLKAFDKLLTGDDPPSVAAQALLNGEKIIEEEISIFLPGIQTDDALIEEFVETIQSLLQAEQLGSVIRTISYEKTSSCIDIYLLDFVAGLDAIRRLLPGFDLPADTTIEYTGGDLPLFDR